MFNLLNTETYSEIMCVLLCVCACVERDGEDGTLALPMGWGGGGGESQQAGVDSAIISL